MLRRLRAWAVLVTAATLGGGAGALAAAWFPAWAATVVGAVGAAVAGGLTARAQYLITEDPAGRSALGRTRRVRVRDVADPLPLGVHPAEAVRAEHGANRLPAFVERDVTAQVCERLRAGGFVLLIGESTAGKSRLAYEAMRTTLPRHRFHHPPPGRPADDVVRLVGAGGRHVVWLDELDLYLGPSRLSVNVLQQLLAGGRRGGGRHVVVLATMRVREYDRYSARHRDAADSATWRTGRSVLLLAGDPIELPRAWSEAELERARSGGADRRVRNAAAKADRFGVAEVLAAGPELVADWRRATTVGGQPGGGALVAAAVDCRRMGLHRPIPLELLLRLQHTYLPAGTRPEPVVEATAWATTVVFGSSSLLSRTAGGFMAFDYLIDQPFLPAVPDASWTTVLATVPPDEAYEVGWAAIELQRPDHAMAAFDHARRHQIANADYAYVVALGNSGRPAAAARFLRGIAATRSARLGPSHPETLQAQHDLARYLGEAGRLDEAVTVLRDVIARHTRVLGAAGPATLIAREFLGRFTGDAGRYDEAVSILTDLATEQRRILGDTNLQPLVTAIHIGRYTTKAGRARDAVTQLADVIDKTADLVGPDSPYCLSARYEHAKAVGAAGQPEQARLLLTHLVRDQQRIVGSRHPRVFSTRHHIARFTSEAGDLPEAVRLLTDLAAERSHLFGARHPRTLASRVLLARCAAQLPTGPQPEDPNELADECHDTLGLEHPLTRLAADTASEVR